ncbi:ABC-2 type transport system ATP-binding protein [Proteiniborus ethanoligenes]|uniref:ABC-2 type transport system ATP-binding protein n=1 Tax=Proteiniborus ethanoligenes TaxID=415015 RepID=A0A1H3P639_9FIRM|nr:ABC transporter ATP-binding protein [Proteiniborus ethanoligenes]TAH63189.1 MAG: ABC transporter ATP-binding protein [Gottschalkiaceae bacterium]SDY96586.1 ABC-2 type transport system ATP-binding protein [Proteiniborus ethanoligenes]
MENILEISNLRKEYEEFTLKDVSLTLPRGYIMGLVGPNGAGKSTTIKAIMNLINYDSGKIKIFGRDYENHEEEIKNRIGYVGEEQFFYEDMSVKWMEKFISQHYIQWDRDEFYNLLERFNVSSTKKVQELSKGMRVKLSLALALAHNPELLILDEPTSGLDPVIRSEILKILLEVIQDENKSVLFSTHITEDIEKIADYVTYIIDGEIILSAPKDDILGKWKSIHIKTGYEIPELNSKLIGIEKNFFGISGLTDQYESMKSMLKPYLEKDIVRVENTSIDQILISFVKEEK